MSEMSREDTKARLYTSGKVIAAQEPPDIGLLEHMCDTTRALNECLSTLSEISVILFGRTGIQGEEVKEGSALKDAVMANMITAGMLMQELRELAGRIGV